MANELFLFFSKAFLALIGSDWLGLGRLGSDILHFDDGSVQARIALFLFLQNGGTWRD